MMGHSHAISGVLVWLVAAPLLASKDIMPDDAATIITGAVVCSGAALFPDLDHPSSTIARFAGPVSKGVSHVINVLAGGHRMATHSLFFVALAALGTWAAVNWGGSIAALAIVFIMAGLAARGLHLGPAEGWKGYASVLSIAAATTIAVMLWGPDNWEWLFFAMAIGVLTHLLGDTLTPGGVPWFFPYKGRFAVPVLPSTGGFVELKILTPLMIVAIVYFAYINLWPQLQHLLPGS